MRKIFIGWDSREPIAADVCEYSLEHNSSRSLDITMLKQNLLRDQGIYKRPFDDKASTEFTFTRFLVPHLMKHQGWALFCDCDFLWVEDVEKLFAQADDRYAVMVVKHDYRPQNKVKMDGQRQEYYPRKNWSSMILWNCAHPKNAQITAEAVNQWAGNRLHRFDWLDDSEIGNLDPAWNWLVGWYHEPWDGKPAALHYTEGGPWFDNYRDCDYAGIWKYYAERVGESTVNRRHVGINDLDMPPTYRDLFTSIVNYVEDPDGKYGETSTKEDIFKWINQAHDNQLVGLCEEEDITKKMKSKGAKWDPVVHALVQGAAGRMSAWDGVKDAMYPVALRSIAKKKIMQHCLEVGRDFYYIDTGYFGNQRLKDYHRVTKNAMQWLGPIEDRPADRWERTGVRVRAMTGGSKILLCPPSAKALSYWGLEEDIWVKNTIKEIKKHTDREIVLRVKQPRTVRMTTDTMEMALANDIHCLVTFNSIAAIEALILGKPVFTMGPNAAHWLSNHDLSVLDNPYIPTMDEVQALMRCLAYHQFTIQEMMDGYAWSVLNGNA